MEGLMTNNKVFYLITQFGLPAPTFQHSYFDQATKCSLPLYGAKIFPVFIYEGKRIGREDKKYKKGRYGICFDGCRRKDADAQRIADCIKSIHTFLHFLTSNESPRAIALPISLLKGSYLSKISIIKNKYLNEWELQEMFGQWTVVSDQTMSEVLELLPYILNRDEYYKAIHYYQDSLTDVHFSDVDLRDHFYGISKWAYESPTSRYDQVRIENSILNSAKTIEALIGEPPKDNIKLGDLLKKYHVIPEKKIWLEYKINQNIPKKMVSILKETNQEKIRELWLYRNKIAAHAKTNSAIKDVPIFRAYDFQKYAAYFLWKALELKQTNVA